MWHRLSHKNYLSFGLFSSADQAVPGALLYMLMVNSGGVLS